MSDESIISGSGTTLDEASSGSAPRTGTPGVLHMPPAPIRVLLLDDDPENLLLRSTILRQQGYVTLPADNIVTAERLLDRIDIAVLDYHLGSGQFGTAVAAKLRQRRPEVPIIILSATLERHFGGVEDMHLLKGYSSVDDLLDALRSFEAKRRGKPVVVDAREFFYSRISLAMGSDVVLQVFDGSGVWQYVNETAATLLEHPQEWFPGRNIFTELPHLADDWLEVFRSVATTRETYIDRTGRGLTNLPSTGSPRSLDDVKPTPKSDSARTDPRSADPRSADPRSADPRSADPWIWNILVFPFTLHDRRPGIVLCARILERKPTA